MEILRFIITGLIVYISLINVLKLLMIFFGHRRPFEIGWGAIKDYNGLQETTDTLCIFFPDYHES